MFEVLVLQQKGDQLGETTGVVVFHAVLVNAALKIDGIGGSRPRNIAVCLGVVVPFEIVTVLTNGPRFDAIAVEKLPSIFKGGAGFGVAVHDD